MRIKQISVTNLFGIFNHVITLNLDEHITIIYGPNGFGKTILLRMIDGVFSGRYEVFRKIPFDEFAITFDNNQRIVVVALYENQPRQAELFNTELEDIPLQQLTRQKFRIILNDGEGEKIGKPYDLSDSFEFDPNLFSRWIARNIPHLVQIKARPGLWHDTRTEDILRQDEVFRNYREAIPRELMDKNVPDWFKNIRDKIKAYLIEAHRLDEPVKRSRRETGMTVLKYSFELAESIQQVLANYATLSQSLDRTFPIRLMEHGEGVVNIADLTQRLEELEKQRSRLIEVGLLDGNEDVLPIPQIREELNNVLSVYVQDAEKKLAVFRDLLEKLELLQEIINSKFKYKRFKVDKDNGFIFISDNGNVIPLENLSSGEQHELVLLYQLLFKVEPDTLVLLDEPELSLHVTWQRRFLDDLQSITKLTNLDILIATHSPQIIGEEWELTVALEGPEVYAERP